MKANFYEKIIPIKDEEKKKLIMKMDKLLDESIDILIILRKRKMNELDNNDIKSKIIDKFNEFSLFQNNESNSNESNNNDNNSNANFMVSRLRELRRQGRLSRLQRILNLEQENEDLNRLIDNNENADVVG